MHARRCAAVCLHLQKDSLVRLPDAMTCMQHAFTACLPLQSSDRYNVLCVELPYSHLDRYDVLCVECSKSNLDLLSLGGVPRVGPPTFADGRNAL